MSESILTARNTARIVGKEVPSGAFLMALAIRVLLSGDPQ
jgi:hypothetical protein